MWLGPGTCVGIAGEPPPETEPAAFLPVGWNRPPTDIRERRFLCDWDPVLFTVPVPVAVFGEELEPALVDSSSGRSL